MSKIITCPVCGDKKPVRNDAKVCSPKCRLKQWRDKVKNIKAVYKGRAADEMVFKAGGKHYYFNGYEANHNKGDICTIGVNRTSVISIQWD